MVEKSARSRSRARKVARTVFGSRKQAEFLAALAMTSNVAASARAVKVQESTIYKLRQRNPDFRRAWAAALAEGYARLELTMLERAINGVEGTEPAGGRVSDRLAITLLTLHAKAVTDERARAKAEAQDGEAEAGDDPVAALVGKLDEMAERMRGAE